MFTSEMIAVVSIFPRDPARYDFLLVKRTANRKDLLSFDKTGIEFIGLRQFKTNRVRKRT